MCFLPPLGQFPAARFGLICLGFHAWPPTPPTPPWPPRLQVLLHIPDPHSKAYVYASSWWSAATIDEYLRRAGVAAARARAALVHERGGDRRTGAQPRQRLPYGTYCDVQGGRGLVGLQTHPRPPLQRCALLETGHFEGPGGLHLPCRRAQQPTPPLPHPLACRDRSQPIWVSLSQGRTELYREILQLELGHCPYLEW